VALRDIAQRQAISQKYLWQVVNPLKTAGFLRSTRGAHGGYELALPPGRITIRDIVNTLEGSVSLVACVAEPDACERSVSCTAREAWSEIEHKLDEAMRAITLQDLLRRHKERERNGAASYVI